MNRLIYLASPYSHPDPEVREARFQAACRAAAEIMEGTGVPVYSPIAHSHPCERFMGSIHDTAWWLVMDRPLMEAATECVILRLDGWDRSRGVAAEHDYFVAAGKPVSFMGDA